jgi:hypothetical protein
LRLADEKSPTLHRAMLRYAHAFLKQAITTALANGRSKLEERISVGRTNEDYSIVG